MYAEILSYEPSLGDRSVNINVRLFEDTGTEVETTRFVVFSDENLSATLFIDRVRDVLQRRVNAKKTMPTVPQLETILPIGFRIQVPG